MLQEIKGKLAKLLATENLIVEHRTVETAQFDVVRRVLTLPNWQISSIDVYDLLVAHEVGHALFTDPRDWSLEPEWCDVPQTFVNITEDARIEKLMKRKYAGLSKTFYRGYSDLNDSDFFDIEDADLDKFSLADRINLHFKLGTHINIKFSEEEMVVVNAVANSETFDDALMAAKILNTLVNDESVTNIPENNQQSGITQESEQQSTEPAPPTSQEGESEDNTEQDSEQDSEQDTENVSEKGEDEYSESGETVTDETESKTADSLKEKLKSLAKMTEEEFNYVTIPEINIKHSVVSAKEIHEYIQNCWSEWAQGAMEENVHSWYKHHAESRMLVQDIEFNKFKKESAKEVNYLVKEFECKKSASSYARATTSRTGVLDCTKLHSYKYSDDLFKKVTVIPDGKNHGLIFVLDWSGSMADVLLSTIKQLYSLIWFCRKVGIPYDVYAFTQEWNYKAGRFSSLEKKEGTIWINDEFSMLNILTSKVNNCTADIQMRNIWKIASSFTDHSGVTPPRMYLSGTPLNEAIITLHDIIPDFKKRYGVEKLNCVILTDGEAPIPSRTVVLRRNWEHEESIRHRRISDNTFLRNLKTGTVRRLSYIYNTFTKCMLDDLKETYPDVNILGFRIIGSGTGSSNMINQYTNSYDEAAAARVSWRKTKSFSLKNCGYDSYFVLGGSILSNETMFEVKEDASKSQIKNAFRKSLSNKKMNKRVLNEFISMVA
jgi:hypothetical protein